MILTHGTNWWQMLICLTVALLLSTAIGFERQLKHKSAGMRTHTLVGLGAALFTIVSKYGFSDIVAEGTVNLDPSRVAAQIVSGIGFIGAGLVFVRRNKVRGLTTAAAIWLTAAVGMSAGAGLVIPAVFVTLTYLVVVYGFPWIAARTSLGNSTVHDIKVRYLDGTGTLRQILLGFTLKGFQIQGFNQQTSSDEHGGVVGRLVDRVDSEALQSREVEVELEVEGLGSVSDLIRHISDLPNVLAVWVEDDE